MDIYQQIRTQQGHLPAKYAELHTEPSARIEFTLCSPSDEELGKRRKDPALGLEDLGLCRGLPQAVEIAGKSGPLFGFSESESIAAWQHAITTAHTAVLLQDALNGQRINDDFFRESLGLVKERYVNPSTGASCLVYSHSFCVRQGTTREYLGWIGRCPLPWSRRFPDANRIDYAVCYLGDVPEEDFSAITIHLFSFESDIGTHDFAALLNIAVDDEQAVASLKAQLDESQFIAEGGESPLRFSDTATAIESANEPFSLADSPQLQHLVQALASLHLEGIHMDVFSTQASEGFMVFPSYLSYLWFNFAQSLASVKVAMCPICGRGFSKAGHRGPDKIYCSDTCKAAARNRKKAEKRDEVRRLFLEEGLSVDEIRHAKMDGAPIGWGKERIIKLLANCKELRWSQTENPDLVLRCLSEDIINKREASTTLKKYLAAHPDEGPRVQAMLRNM